MFSLIRLCRHSPCLSPAANAVAVTAMVVWAIGAEAAEPEAVLRVPADSGTLDLASDLPNGFVPQTSGTCRLVEIGHPDVTLPAQFVPAMAADGSADDDGRQLIASIPPCDAKQRRFRLEGAAPPEADSAPGFRFRAMSDKSLGVWDGRKPVFVYNHGLITDPDVPETDHRRSRECYVHPVYGLSGEVLTDDFPRDHYHHHGIFWTWPHVGIDGQEHDLWAGDTIRQEFVGWLCREAGPVAAVLGVENGWFVGDRKVMIERVWLRAYRAAGQSRSLDLELVLIPVGNPVTLWGAEGKSYGGLTMRFAPPSRNDENTVITIPRGPTDVDLSVTRLPWADYTSTLGGHAAPSGAAVMIHPEHPDYPPTWLLRHYGPLCVGWPGVTPRTLPPDEPVRLAYRIWIHKTPADVARLRQAYTGYRRALKARWR